MSASVTGRRHGWWRRWPGCWTFVSCDDVSLSWPLEHHVDPQSVVPSLKAAGDRCEDVSPSRSFRTAVASCRFRPSVFLCLWLWLWPDEGRFSPVKILSPWWRRTLYPAAVVDVTFDPFYALTWKTTPSAKTIRIATLVCVFTTELLHIEICSNNVVRRWCYTYISSS